MSTCFTVQQIVNLQLHVSQGVYHESSQPYLGHKIGSEFSMVDRGSLHVVSGDRALRCLLQSHTWGGHESWIKLVSTASARIASWQAKRCSLFQKGVGVQISSYPVHVQNVFEHGKPVRHSLLVLNLAATGLTCHRRILERRSFSEFWKRRREDTMPWYKQLSVFYSILSSMQCEVVPCVRWVCFKSKVGWSFSCLPANECNYANFLPLYAPCASREAKDSCILQLWCELKLSINYHKLLSIHYHALRPIAH